MNSIHRTSNNQTIKPSNHQTIILGTAMWGWTLTKETCFQLLDHFYATGFRQVDTATNYPINKQAKDFRAAEQILSEWIKSRGVTDLQVIMKVGSINNLFTPEHNLKKSFLLLNLDDYQHSFGSNLHTFMIHWDNREEEKEIEASLEALVFAAASGLQVGLSGIKFPAKYARLNTKFKLDLSIQIKHNLFYSDLDRYGNFPEKTRFLVYGINAGGVKLDTASYHENSTLIARGGKTEETTLHQQLQVKLADWNQYKLPTPISSFYQIGMINAYHHPAITGILIGPSSVEQLKNNINFYDALKSDAYQPIYQDLKTLSEKDGHS